MLAAAVLLSGCATGKQLAVPRGSRVAFERVSVSAGARSDVSTAVATVLAKEFEKILRHGNRVEFLENNEGASADYTLAIRLTRVSQSVRKVESPDQTSYDCRCETVAAITWSPASGGAGGIEEQQIDLISTIPNGQSNTGRPWRVGDEILVQHHGMTAARDIARELGLGTLESISDALNR